jgi:hypothetical protein
MRPLKSRNRESIPSTQVIILKTIVTTSSRITLSRRLGRKVPQKTLRRATRPKVNQRGAQKDHRYLRHLQPTIL